MLILMTCIVIVGILGGGYYVSVSAVTGIVLTGVLFYRMYVKKRITAAWDLNMAAFAVLVFDIFCLVYGRWIREWLLWES